MKSEQLSGNDDAREVKYTHSYLSVFTVKPFLLSESQTVPTILDNEDFWSANQ